MQFYDFFKELISYIPERFNQLNAVFDAAMPFVLMACALLTAFFGLKCVSWWCSLTFFFLGAGLSSKYLIKDVDIYSEYFWVMLGISISAGVVLAVFSKYPARLQLLISQFVIIYAALPHFIIEIGENAAKAVGLIVALAVTFLTVKYKYLITIPTTAFTGSFIFWDVAFLYGDFGNERLNGILMGIIALGFQCIISKEQIKETYNDVKKKVKITEKEGRRAVHFVERKMETRGVSFKNIKLKGAKNLRDLGGIPVEGGKIRKNMLFRSGHLNAITEADSNIIVNGCKIKTVIDLRNSAEKKEKPDTPIEGVKLLEIPVFDSSIPGLSHETKQNLDSVPDMTELYAAVANGKSFINLCAAAQTIILSPKERFAFLYHCTEGKDRTGMLTAILLTVLGVDRQIIIDEYLFTNTVNRKKALLYYILVRTVKHNKRAANLVYNVFIAREEYLNEIFKVIDKIGTDEFISDYLKITPEQLNAFKEKMIEPLE